MAKDASRVGHCQNGGSDPNPEVSAITHYIGRGTAMRIHTVIAWIAGLVIAGVLVTNASAQKVHAPKQVWPAMIANLSDLQDMTASLMVFDMKRIESTANELAAREEFISKIEQLPDAVKEGHAEVAKAAQALAEIAAFGEEQEVAKAIGQVTAACTACHYDLRDAERREKME